MLRLLIAISFAVVAMLASAPARAAMEPDVVAAEVREAAKTCRDMGGRPDTAAMLKVQDLDGDGGEDWIVDYAKMRCAGTSNPFCGSGGCGLTVYVWAGGANWTKVFDSVVQSWRFVSRGGQSTFHVSFGGSECGKSNAESCPRSFVFRAGTLTPLR